MHAAQRLWRHAWTDAHDARRALSPHAGQRLAQAIADSERQHSGEIRICIEGGLPTAWLWPLPTDADMPVRIRQRARDWFGRLGVWDTAHNNGVLIYLLLAERAIEVVADRGLDAHVRPAQWQALVQSLAQPLQAGDFEGGLMHTVTTLTPWLVASHGLEAHAPNANELPDAVVWA